MAVSDLGAPEPGADRGAMQRDAVGGTLWTALQTVLGLPLSIVANAVVAHSLGTSAYGTLATYLAVYALVGGVVGLGVNDASVQWLATQRARGEGDEVLATIRRCSGYHVFVQAPLLSAVVAAMLWQAGPLAMMLGAVVALVTTVLGTSTIVMTGSALNALAARISIVVTLATQSTLIAVALTTQQPGTVFLSRIAVLSLGPAFALLVIPQPYRRAVLRPVLPRRWPSGFLPYALRTCAAGVVGGMVFSRTELFVFQANGLSVEAGLFALAAGVGGLVTAPIDAILGPLLPAAAAILATTPEHAGRVLLKGLRMSTTLAGLAAVGAIPLVAPLIPLVYGREYEPAVGAFVALAVVSCIQSMNHPALAFQLGARRTGLLLANNLVALAVDVGLAVLLVPRLGVAGGVVASAAGQLVALGLTTVQVMRMLDVPRRQVIGAMSFAVDAAICTAAGLAAGHEAAGLGPIGAAAAGLVAALGSLLVVSRLRTGTGMAPDDVAAIRSGLPAPLQRPFQLFVDVFALRTQGGPQDVSATAR